MSQRKKNCAGLTDMRASRCRMELLASLVTKAKRRPVISPVQHKHSISTYITHSCTAAMLCNAAEICKKWISSNALL